MSTQQPLIPPPPVPYEYNPPEHAIRVIGGPHELYLAAAHMKLRDPVYVKGAGAAPKFIAAGALLALFMLPRMLYPVFASTPLNDPLILVMRASPLFGLATLVVGVWALVGASRSRLQQRDPLVAARVFDSATRDSLVRALTPASYELVAQLATDLPYSLGYRVQRHFGLTVRSQGGWEAGLEERTYSTSSSRLEGNRRITTTTSHVTTTYTVRAAHLPADIGVRLAALQSLSMPQVPNTAVQELGVQNGAVRLVLKSRDNLTAATHATFTNVIAQAAGFAAPVFNAVA